MIKNVSINAAETPSGNIDLANSIIGKTVEPQLRWSPGSLVNSAMNLSEKPLHIIISRDSLALADASGFATGDLVNQALAMAGLAAGYIGMEIFSAEVGEARSKMISNGKISTVQTITVDESDLGDDHPVFQLFAPKRPSFTVLSLVNAIESALINHGDNYVILVDQSNETVTVILFDSPANSEGFAVAWFGTQEGDVKVASFSTTFEASAGSTPSFGWE